MNGGDRDLEVGLAVGGAVWGAVLLRSRQHDHGWELVWMLPLYAAASLFVVGLVAIPVGYLAYRWRERRKPRRPQAGTTGPETGGDG